MLRFTSLTIENFGPFKGNQTIDFTNDNGVPLFGEITGGARPRCSIFSAMPYLEDIKIVGEPMLTLLPCQISKVGRKEIIASRLSSE